MIRKYVFGNPFPTGAVTPVLPAETGNLPFFKKENGSLTLRLEKAAPVYGLGEQVRGTNKRGWHYTSNCTDIPNHTEHTPSLYGVHNFLLIGGETPFGIFLDYPGYVTFDIGYTCQDILTITPQEWDFDLYIIEAEDCRYSSVVRQFRRLIGRSYIPPKWAFGYGQSRWGYKNESDIREVAQTYRENKIPLDAIYMDIDYMERYKDFTVDAQRFPDLKKLTADMRKLGIHLVPIIDAGVKVEEGYPVYEEGVENGYFCKEEDGTDFVAAVWPGFSHFPDFLNPSARQWFGMKYKLLLDMGIDGFWNDMNEPAIFYSKNRLQKTLEKLESFKGQNLALDKTEEMLALVNTLANNPEDYQSFYHETSRGRIRHDKVHNLYGYYMTLAAAEAFETLSPDKRILMFSRSSYIGMHRAAGIWQGDNLSWWSHLQMNVKMMPSLNMCGFLYTGADLGGFGADTTEDLLLRWLQFGIFTPLMRNHSAMGTRPQEAYRFSNMEALKRTISLRYCLVPYLYSEYMKAALNDEMLFRPLSFDYQDDPQTLQAEDQLLLGESLMLSPICQQNATGRYVYLPEDMLLVTASGPDDFRFQKMSAGHHYVKAAMEEVIFFIRKGHLLPLAPSAQSVEALDTRSLTLVGYLDKDTTYNLYEDDGMSTVYDEETHTLHIRVTEDGSVSCEGAGEEKTFRTVIYSASIPGKPA